MQIEAGDVGPLLKVRVGHDGKGAFAGWYLDKVCEQYNILFTSSCCSLLLLIDFHMLFQLSSANNLTPPLPF
jgi:hypothetical protein